MANGIDARTCPKAGIDADDAPPKSNAGGAPPGTPKDGSAACCFEAGVSVDGTFSLPMGSRRGRLRDGGVEAGSAAGVFACAGVAAAAGLAAGTCGGCGVASGLRFSASGRFSPHLRQKTESCLNKLPHLGHAGSTGWDEGGFAAAFGLGAFCLAVRC